MSQPANNAREAASDSVEILDVLRLLYARKFLILGVATAVGIGVFFWTLSLPKVYQATCTIEYDPSPPRPLGREVEDVALPIVNVWMTREWYETQNMIIASRSIAERVVTQLALHRDPDFMGVPTEARAEWEPVSPELAARTLQGRMTVTQAEGTRMVQIAVEDGDPERAAVLANTIADAYIERTTQERLASTVTAIEYLSQQLDSINHRLHDSENALHEFKDEHNVLSVSLEDQQNTLAADLTRYTQALSSARILRAEVSARLAGLRRANVDDPMSVHHRLVDESAAVQSLRRQHEGAQAELDELLARYGESWHDVQRVRARLGRIEADMRREIDGLVRSVEAELVEIRSREAQYQAQLEQLEQQGLALNLREIEYNRLTREQENNAKLYSLLLERTAETNMTRALKISQVRMVDRALPPELHIRPRMRLNLPVGAAIGLLLGFGLAFVLSRLDRSIRSAEDAEALGLTVLGVLPRIAAGGDKGGYYARRPPRAGPVRPDQRDLVVHTHPMSAIAENIRTLRTNLTFMSADRPFETLVVTSPNPLEGKTTVAISLAIAMAQSGKRVLLIDTDLRRPRVHRAFSMSSRVGATSVLVGEAEFSAAVQESVVPRLSVLPAGPIPPNPSELLHTARFKELIELGRETYDRVILDSPPLRVVTDAAVIGPQVDGVLVVVRGRSTTRDALSAVLRQLRDINANVAGGVVNDLDDSERGIGSGGYYYRANKGYYYREDEIDDALDDDPPPRDGGDRRAAAG